jgi:hypothetical protein
LWGIAEVMVLGWAGVVIVAVLLLGDRMKGEFEECVFGGEGAVGGCGSYMDCFCCLIDSLGLTHQS